METKILSALDAFRAGDDEAAFAELLALTDEVVPTIANFYRQEEDPDARAFLVTVAWERHEANSVEFVFEALKDPVEEVWQAALDGTVALASEEILGSLKAAREHEHADATMTRRFQICVDEAILYIEGILQGGQRPQSGFTPAAFKR